MKASFFEYHVATTALHTARMGLSVTNHNIANAATPGYSRQFAQIRAGSPLKLFTGRGMIGTGSDVTGVNHIRDLYLDMKYRNENCVLGEYEAKQTQLNYLENILNDLADTGLNALLDGLFASMQELSQNPSDGTYRTNMLRAAESMTEQVNLLGRSLKAQQDDINMEIASTIQIMNGIGHQIRNLNEQITRLEADGSTANDLRDSRANLLDELSKYINIETKEVVRNTQTGQKEFVVLVNGYTFIDHFSINPMAVEKRSERLNPTDADGMYDIYFSNTKQKMNIYSPHMKGDLKGLIDVRDGNNGAHFTKTAASTTTLIDSKTLRITSPSRVDLNQTGTIQIKNPSTGVISEHDYTSFTLNSDGSVVFTFDSDLPAYADEPNATITSGKTINYKGIPYYLDRLNNYVRTTAMAFNEGVDRNGNPVQGVTGHIYGYDLYGDQGNRLFSYENIQSSNIRTDGGLINYNLINCENFRVDSGVLNDPKKIAAAMHPGPDVDDNEVMLGLLGLNTTTSLFAEGKIADYLASIAGELGIDIKQSVNFTLNYTDVTVSIDIQRKAVSGVDLNEESINIVKYNQMYHAAATLINTIDGIYDTMINRLGNF